MCVACVLQLVTACVLQVKYVCLAGSDCMCVAGTHCALKRRHVDGFNRIFGFKEVNEKAMTKYGKCVYFAVNSKYSVDYTSPNSRGERHMFLCRVLVGDYCQGREDQPTPDVRWGKELYDSTVNNLADPTIFVTYHDSQAYPEYLVTFTKQ